MKKTVGLIFSGYGGQFITMGKDIYNESRQVQDFFEQASMCLDMNFVQLSFASSATEIAAIDKGYLAILLMQISIYHDLSQAGLRPDFIAGFGVGEYAAAVASGSLSFSDGLYLLSKYAKLYKAFVEQHPQYTVLQLTKGFELQDLQLLCQEWSDDEKKIMISAHVSQEGFLVAGHVDLIEKLKKYCVEHEIRKVKQLSAAYGLHGALLDDVVAQLAPYLFKVDFKPLKFPVIINADGVYVTSPDSLESALLRQINSPLLWHEVMQGFVGCQVLIYVGPGKQLVELAQAQYPDKEIYFIEKLDELKQVTAMLQEPEQAGTQVADQVEQITFGQCRVDDDIVTSLSQDLTIADEINELPQDYDDEEEEEGL